MMSQVKKKDTLSNPLNKSELARWDQLDNIVRKGFDTFVEVGLALGEIHSQKLYRAKYPSWGAYCDQGLEKNRSSVLRQIESAKAVKMLPMGNILPTSERQARELLPLGSMEERQQAWERVVDISQEENKPATWQTVRAVVTEMRAPGHLDDEGEAGDGEAQPDAEELEQGEQEQEPGEAQPDGEELEPILLADGSEVPDEVWVDGMFDRKLMQTRVDELSEEGDPGSVPRQRLLVGIISLMNQFLDQHPENESFQDLKAVSSSINKVLLVGAKPGYYGDVV